MSEGYCALLQCGLLDDGRALTLGDFEGALPRWCSGCGDYAVLTASQRLLAEEGLAPERTVFVSGIGCSGRFPHHVRTYGFHGIHGRALPVATGVKLSRPDLAVFVVMGDGDCTSIGAGHWLHATRYNVDMVAIMLDNNIYGLTKKQTSPTTPQGLPSNTQPRGTPLPALDPIQATLGITNASFVAQTVEWIPPHLLATLRAAYRHDGFAFVRILQRCPTYMPTLFEQNLHDPDTLELLEHDDGVVIPGLQRRYGNRRLHNPAGLDAARRLADDTETVRIGVFFRDRSRPRYDVLRRPAKHDAEARVERLERELDRHAV